MNVFTRRFGYALLQSTDASYKNCSTLVAVFQRKSKSEYISSDIQLIVPHQRKIVAKIVVKKRIRRII